MLRKPDDIYDVLLQMLQANPHGKKDKEVAVEVRPDLNVDSAKAWLNKALNRDDRTALRPEEMVDFCRACGNVERLINFLCDEFGFERPPRKVVLTPEKELKVIRQLLKEKGIDVDVEGYIQEHKGIVSLEAKNNAPRPPLTLRGGENEQKKSRWWVRFLGRSGRA